MLRLIPICPILAALLAMFSSHLQAEEKEGVFPKISVDEVIPKITSKHPRIMVTEENFKNAKAAIQNDGTYKSWWQKIQTKADKLLSEPPVKYELLDGVRLLMISRRALDRVQVLAFSFQMTGDAKYKDRLWQEMDAIIQFQDWHPVHFLDVAEMTTAAAIAYDWLYDAWSPEQKSKIKKAIIEKGLEAGLTDYRNPKKFWPKCEHNWNQVCNGGLGVGALAIAEDIPDIAKEILQNALSNLPLAMKHYGPDGAWGEGPGYWAYATSYTVFFLSSLEASTGSDWGLSGIPGFSLAGDFPLYLNGPTGNSYNFADASEHPVHGSEMYWLSKKFSTQEYALFEQKFSDKSPGPLDLLWGIPALANKDLAQAAPRPLNKYFRETEVAVLRSDATDKKAFYVGIKSGSNKVNHSHLDCGSFILEALGKRWGKDPGADDYNLPGYFGKQRWDYYRLRAEGHNTLVFNPDFNPDQNPKGDTKIVKFSEDPSFAFAIVDLSGVYSEHATKVMRGFALQNKNSLIVQDEITSSNPNDLWWFFHTQAEIKLDENKKTALLNYDGDQLSVRILSPSHASFEVMDAVPLPTSPQPAKQMVKQPSRKIQKLAIHLLKAKDTNIAVEFALPETSPAKVIPLDEWK